MGGQGTEIDVRSGQNGLLAGGTADGLRAHGQSGLEQRRHFHRFAPTVGWLRLAQKGKLLPERAEFGGIASHSPCDSLDGTKQVDENRHGRALSIRTNGVLKQHGRAAFGEQTCLYLGHFESCRNGFGDTYKTPFLFEMSDKVAQTGIGRCRQVGSPELATMWPDGFGEVKQSVECGMVQGRMEDRIRHAKSYPFEIPERSYVYRRGTVHDFDTYPRPRDGRVPVLAAGSNQSHRQIGRKFDDHPSGDVIPSQRGRLHDFDVVYAAHIASYGSIPATFQHSPGTVVSVFVLWLDEPQLARMHETEGNYTFDHLDPVRIELDDHSEILNEAYSYSSKIGCLNHAGSCVSLSEISASGRRYAAANQPDILGIVRDRLAPGRALDDFVGDHVGDDSVRHQRSQAIGQDALPLKFTRRSIADL